MLQRKTITTVISFVLIAGMLSLSIYATAGAAASSSMATANVSITYDANLLARVSMGNIMSSKQNRDEGYKKSVGASIYATDVPNYPQYPINKSSAEAWIEDKIVASDDWP